MQVSAIYTNMHVMGHVVAESINLVVLEQPNHELVKSRWRWSVHGFHIPAL